MTIDGVNFRLTKHGRARFLERVSSEASDREILLTCYHGCHPFQPVWKPDRNDGFRLITVLDEFNTVKEGLTSEQVRETIQLR